MVQVVPTQPIASQTLQCQVGGQAVTLNIYQQPYGLYVDVLVGATPIIQGVIGLNGTLIVRNTYLGFLGDFIFLDTQPPTGSLGEPPVFTGVGTRWQLLYLSAADIAALNLPSGVE